MMTNPQYQQIGQYRDANGFLTAVLDPIDLVFAQPQARFQLPVHERNRQPHGHLPVGDRRFPRRGEQISLSQPESKQGRPLQRPAQMIQEGGLLSWGSLPNRPAPLLRSLTQTAKATLAHVAQKIPNAPQSFSGVHALCHCATILSVCNLPV